jgi:hypothetical protein
MIYLVISHYFQSSNFKLFSGRCKVSNLVARNQGRDQWVT